MHMQSWGKQLTSQLVPFAAVGVANLNDNPVTLAGPAFLLAAAFAFEGVLSARRKTETIASKLAQ